MGRGAHHGGGHQNFSNASSNGLSSVLGEDKLEFKKKQATVKSSNKVLNALLIIIVVAYYALLAFGKYFLPEDGEFFQSINVFSGAEDPNFILRLVSFTILVFSLSKGLRIFLFRLTKEESLTEKTGVAVINLFGNVVKFVAPVLWLIMILNAAGVQTAEMVAGLGVLSLILGLGVTSMVEDIVAGIFIIIDRTFDVGDIVTIDGFRGKVIAIGMRSTQIQDEGGDILILRNSSVGSLVNMTDIYSYAYCDIFISPDEPIEHFEQVLEDSFVEIRGKIPDIVKGPFYKGIIQMDAHGMEVEIVAICDEIRKYDIESALYRELKIVFDNNDIKLGFETR